MNSLKSTLLVSYQICCTSSATFSLFPIWKYDLSQRLQHFFQVEAFSETHDASMQYPGDPKSCYPVYLKMEIIRLNQDVSKLFNGQPCILSGSVKWITGKGFSDKQIHSPKPASLRPAFWSQSLENCIAYLQPINAAYEDDFFININYHIFISSQPEAYSLLTTSSRNRLSSLVTLHPKRSKINTFV